MRNKVVSWLAGYKGIAEGSAKHRELLSVYNNSGLATYTMSVRDAWCACAVSAAFIANGLAGKPGSGSVFECVTVNTEVMISMAKAQGTWIEDDAYVPNVGDVILYAWKDSGKGDCTLETDHVGLVASVSSTTITVIEGNISHTVGYRNIEINGRYIRGFIAPKYEDSESVVVPDDREPFNMAEGLRLWTNKNITLPVYQTSALDTKIGSMSPNEQAWCVGRLTGTQDAFLIYYHVDDEDWCVYKAGWVAYDGGTGW